jgi:hypothetical protein
LAVGRLLLGARRFFMAKSEPFRLGKMTRTTTPKELQRVDLTDASDIESMSPCISALIH